MRSQNEVVFQLTTAAQGHRVFTEENRERLQHAGVVNDLRSCVAFIICVKNKTSKVCSAATCSPANL